MVDEINRCRFCFLKFYSHFACFWAHVCESIVDVCDCVHCQILGVKVACVDSPSFRQSLTTMLPNFSKR